jgi:hypothetical protein
MSISSSPLVVGTGRILGEENIYVKPFIYYFSMIGCTCSLTKQVFINYKTTINQEKVMEGDIGFHFTIPPELLAKLKARAKQQGVTVAGLLRTIIKREVGKL